MLCYHSYDTMTISTLRECFCLWHTWYTGKSCSTQELCFLHILKLLSL